MLRAIRFATQLDFKIENKSLAAIKENAERLSIISKERIIDELNKIILSDTPSRGFKLLYSTHRSEEHTSELQSRPHLVCRLLLEKKKKKKKHSTQISK